MPKSLKLTLVAAGLLLLSILAYVWRDAQEGNWSSDYVGSGVPSYGGAAASGSTSALRLVGGNWKQAFFCTFANSPTDCGFRLQARKRGRATIVNVGRDGGTALRLRTEPGDNNVAGSGTMERTDLWLTRADAGCYEGREQLWELSVLFPDDFAFPKWHPYALANFHHEGGSGANLFEFGFRKDPTGDLKPGILRFRGAAGNTSASPAVRYQSTAISSPQRNVWYDIVFHIKWSSGADGFFHAWVNGQKHLAHDGPTLFAGEGAYLKLANYHAPICDPYPACIGVTNPPSSVIYDRVVRYDPR